MLRGLFYGVFCQKLFCWFLVFGLVVGVSALYAQQKVEGKVMDADDRGALPGASILVKESLVGFLSHADGGFSFEVESGAVLVFSFVGYETKEILISEHLGEDTDEVLYLEVMLRPEVEQLRDIVVVASGHEVNSRMLNYLVQGIKTSSYIDPGRTGLGSNWLTKLPGVEVYQSSGAGAPTTIRIRGNSSIRRTNTPLVVMDGIPFEIDGYTSVSINPHDIESVTVLKGAAATSLYGARGAAGVLIIKSKQGTVGGAVGDTEE